MWHLWLSGATTPVVFEDQTVLHAYMNTLAAGTVCIVHRFDVIQRETRAYNVPGGDAFPPNPTNLPAITDVQFTHKVRSTT